MPIAILFSVLLALSVGGHAIAEVRPDCPFGLVDDPAPGACGRYIDKNGDQICDYSQDPPAAPHVQDKALALNSGTTEKAVASQGQKKAGQASRYAFFPVLAFLLGAYLLSLYSVKAKYYNMVFHRRAWNFFLLSFFLLSALSGLFLVLKINYKISFNWPFNLLYWHVETGLAMAIVSVFHIIWHIPYFKNIFKKSDSLRNGSKS